MDNISLATKMRALTNHREKEKRIKKCFLK